jgi:hypothetical protein
MDNETHIKGERTWPEGSTLNEDPATLWRCRAGLGNRLQKVMRAPCGPHEGGLTWPAGARKR